MKLKYIIPFAAILGASCASNPITRDSPEPRRITGCSEYEGRQKLACISNSIKIWQERENAPGKETVIKTTKDSGFFAKSTTQHVKICWSDFCREEIRTYRRPTLIGYIAVAVGSLAGGFGLGKVLLTAFFL